MSKHLLFVAVILIAMVGAAVAVEMKDGAFPVGTDYQKEKERQGVDPENYKKVYHRVIPGGSEHAEVSASNGPGSNSWSQTYSKHQSFGSADTVQSQSYSSSNGTHGSQQSSESAKNLEAAKASANAMSQKIRNDIAKAQKDAMARHNEMMASIQQSMGMGLGGMGGMGGMGMPQFGLEPKTYYADNSFNEFMKSHMRVMREMWRLQNAQIQALQRLIESSQGSPEAFPPKFEGQKPATRRLQDSEAVAEAVDDLKTAKNIR